MSIEFLDHNLALEAVKVAEVAVLSSSFHMGKENEKAAVQTTVNAMCLIVMRSKIKTPRYIHENHGLTLKNIIS